MPTAMRAVTFAVAFAALVTASVPKQEDHASVHKSFLMAVAEAKANETRLAHPSKEGHFSSLFGETRSCKIDAGIHRLTVRPTVADPRIQYFCEKTGLTRPCACLSSEILLNYFFNGQIKQSCCPITNPKCSGCAHFKGGRCLTCLGGYYMIGGACVRCKNEGRFIDKDGHSCATYEENGWCASGIISTSSLDRAKLRYQHRSASESCCACGGGVYTGVPFYYREQRVAEVGLLGTSYIANPVPLAASSYIVDSDCDLANFGLNLNGKTGTISGTSTYSAPFDLTCKVTARMNPPDKASSLLNPQFIDYNATVSVKAKQFGFQANDDANREVVSSLMWDEFSSSRTYTMRFAPSIDSVGADVSMSCSPRTWLRLDKVRRTIDITTKTRALYRSEFLKFPGNVRAKNTSSTPSGAENLMASRCTIVVVLRSGVKMEETLNVFLYPPVNDVEDFDYFPTNSFRVTVGQPLVNKLKLGYPNSDSPSPKKVPGLIGVRYDCTSSTRHKVEHNVVTGEIMILGLPIFKVSPDGTISGSPHVGLRAFMPSTVGRSYFQIQCSVYGAIASAQIGQLAFMKAKAKLVVQVDSDVCWVDAFNYVTRDGWSPVLVSGRLGVNANTALKCKAACVKLASCVGFHFISGTKICQKLAMSLPNSKNIERKNEARLRDGATAQIKIANCQVHQTCVDVSVTGQKYLSGIYCPILKESSIVPLPIYIKPGFHPDDTFYLEPYKQNKHDPLPSGCTSTTWVLRKGSLKYDDIIDIETSYVELHGRVEACLERPILSGPSSTVLPSTTVLLENLSPTLLDMKTIHGATTVSINQISLSESEERALSKMGVPPPRTNARSIFDSVPEGDADGNIAKDTATVQIKVHPMGSACRNPLLRVKDSQKDKSTEKDEAGNEEKESKEELKAEEGLIKGPSIPEDNEIRRVRVFVMDDPATKVVDDYHLHSCECGFQEWGENEPVTPDTFTKASKGGLNTDGGGFNRMTPDPFLLWSGPYLCEDRFMIDQIYDTESCQLECDGKQNVGRRCRFYAEVESSAGRACVLYNDCQTMVRQLTSEPVVANVYAFFTERDGLMCQVANPQDCHDNTKRREFVTSISAGYKTCQHQSLIEQCDFNSLMGDAMLEGCGVCTYYSVDTQDVKTSPPDNFPHGSQMKIGCLKDRYSLLKNKVNGAVTCVNGEWRDDRGQLGLTNLQCAGCVQLFNSDRKGPEHLIAKMEELLFLGSRKVRIWHITDRYNPQYIEIDLEQSTQSYRIVNRDYGTAAPKWYWTLKLMGSSALQLKDTITDRNYCLGLKTHQMLSRKILDVFSMNGCTLPVSLLQMDSNVTTRSSSVSASNTSSYSYGMIPSQALGKEATGDRGEVLDGGGVRSEGIKPEVPAGGLKPNAREQDKVVAKLSESKDRSASDPAKTPTAGAKEEFKTAFERALVGKKKSPPPPTGRPTRFPTRFPTPLPTPAPTPFPTPRPTTYPTSQDKILTSPLEIFFILNRQEITYSAPYSLGYNCGGTGVLKSFHGTKICTRRSTPAASTAMSPPVLVSAPYLSFTIRCPPGEVMRRLSVSGGNNFRAECVKVPGLSKCISVSGNDDHDRFDPIISAKELQLECPVAYAVAQLQSRYDAQGKKNEISVECCEMPTRGGMSLAKDFPMHGFQQREGIYCPTGYDDLLRPLFLQTKSYKKVNFRSGFPILLETGAKVPDDEEIDEESDAALVDKSTPDAQYEPGEESFAGQDDPNVANKEFEDEDPSEAAQPRSEEPYGDEDRDDGEDDPADDPNNVYDDGTKSNGNPHDENMADADNDADINRKETGGDIIANVDREDDKNSSGSVTSYVTEESLRKLRSEQRGEGGEDSNDAEATSHPLESHLDKLESLQNESSESDNSGREFQKTLAGKNHRHNPHRHNPHRHRPHFHRPHFHRPHHHTPLPTRFPTRYPTKYPTGFPTPYPTQFTPLIKRSEIKFDETTEKWCVHDNQGQLPTDCARSANKEHPLKVDWLRDSQEGIKFSVLGLVPLVGKGMEASPFGTAQGAEEGAPTFPELVEFETVEPEYHEGCALIKEGEFSNAQELFTDADPCGITAAYTWTVKGEKKGPGIDYASLDACFTRQSEREVGSARKTFAYDGAALLAGWPAEILKGKVCPNLPADVYKGSLTINPGAGYVLGFTKNIESKCSDTAEYIARAIKAAARGLKEQWDYSLAEINKEECDSHQASINRALCDIFCIEDAVKVGTNTIIRNIEGAVSNLLTNSNLLMNYYSKVMTTELKASIKEHLLKSTGPLHHGTADSITKGFKETVDSYLAIAPRKRLMNGQRYINPRAAEIVHDAHVKANGVLADAQRKISGSQVSVDEGKNIMNETTKKVDAILGRAYALATDETMKTEPGTGGSWVREKTTKFATMMSDSLLRRKFVYEIHQFGNNYTMQETERLYKQAQELTETVHVTGMGLLNYKVDALSDKVDKMREKLFRFDLRQSIESLSNHWDTVSRSASSYVAMLLEEVHQQQRTVDAIAENAQCNGKSTPHQINLIQSLTRETQFAADKAAEHLRNVWVEVLSAVEMQKRSLEHSNVFEHAIVAATQNVDLKGDDPKSEGIGSWIGNKGIARAHALLVKSIDGLATGILGQVQSTYLQAGFLIQRLQTDDGDKMGVKEERLRLLNAIDSVQKLITEQLNPLLHNSTVKNLVIRTIDFASKYYPAPKICRELAFENSREWNTDQMTVYGACGAASKTKNCLIIGPKPGLLLSKDGPNSFNVELSKKWKQHPIPSGFPFHMMRHFYKCSRDTQSPAGWNVTSSLKLPHAERIIFCSADKCTGAKNEIEVATDALEKTNLKGSAMMFHFGPLISRGRRLAEETPF